MKVRFKKWYSALLTTVLSMLGFESCDFSDVEGPVEYGTPYVRYEVNGTVTDETGSPIQGIKASVKEIYDYQDGTFARGLDSIQTDAAGRFAFHVESFPQDKRMKLVVEDIDGEDNGGEFQSDTLTIADLEAKKLEEGSGWYSGKYEVTADIKMKRK